MDRDDARAPRRGCSRRCWSPSLAIALGARAAALVLRGLGLARRARARGRLCALVDRAVAAPAARPDVVRRGAGRHAQRLATVARAALARRGAGDRALRAVVRADPPPAGPHRKDRIVDLGIRGTRRAGHRRVEGNRARHRQGPGRGGRDRRDHLTLAGADRRGGGGDRRDRLRPRLRDLDGIAGLVSGRAPTSGRSRSSSPTRAARRLSGPAELHAPSSGARRSTRSCSGRWRSSRRRCPGCATAAGAGSSTSARRRSASRSPNLVLSNAQPVSRARDVEDDRPPGRAVGRDDEQLMPGPHRHRQALRAVRLARGRATTWRARRSRRGGWGSVDEFAAAAVFLCSTRRATSPARRSPSTAG